MVAAQQIIGREGAGSDFQNVSKMPVFDTTFAF
jgi:hypothetical protein